VEPRLLWPRHRWRRHYSVQVGQGRQAGKEGLKPGQTATCSASFTVKEYEPPTISCSANPSTIKPGFQHHHSRSEPQNRPLTYSYTASAGSVTAAAQRRNSPRPARRRRRWNHMQRRRRQGHTATANTTVTISVRLRRLRLHTRLRFARSASRRMPSAHSR